MKLLDLSHQRHKIKNFLKYITELDDDIDFLDLSNNELNHDELKGVKFPSKLRTLKLNNNNIRHLHGITFPGNLKYLDLTQSWYELQDCQIDESKMEDCVKSLIHIPKLTIWGVSIGFQGSYYEMRVLNLQQQQSSKIIKELSNIEELDEREKKADTLFITYEMLWKECCDDERKTMGEEYKLKGRLKGFAKAINIINDFKYESNDNICEYIALKLILNKKSNIPFAHPILI